MKKKKAKKNNKNKSAPPQDSKKSRVLSTAALAASLAVLVAVVAAISYTQLADRREKSNVYYGKATFERPACVVYQKLLEATPEYQELTKLLGEKQIDRGDPKATSLMSSADDKVRRAISQFAKENGYDYVCELSYWEKKTHRGTAAGDVTDQIADLIRQAAKQT